MVEPRTRFWILTAIGAVLAVVIGAQLADGTLGLALAVLLLPAIVILERWVPAGAIGVILGGLIAGNVIGNRGFAQLAPSASLPLFPAEIGLAAGALWLLMRGARGRELPVRFDALGFAVMVWIVLSSLRLPFDVRAYGLVAARDYALVYYAGFFFVARHAAASVATRRALHSTWSLAIAGLIVLYPLYEHFEFFFQTQLTVRGAPLIAIKNDLAGTFAAAGAMYAAMRWTESRQLRWSLLLIASLGLALYMVTRAAFVGMLVSAIFFMPGTRLKLAHSLVILLVLGALLAGLQMAGGERAWRDTRLYDVYEHSVSLLDVTGSRDYQGQESQDTGDNTRFRRVWWQLLFDRTWQETPLTGAGYGADISSEFARDYLGPGAGDFTARSPHNVVLTVFARTGFAGLLPFLAMVFVFVREARRAAVRADRGIGPSEAIRASALHCAALVIFVSACFGVVLEGPMGAVVFWTLLGTAMASTDRHLSDSDAIGTGEMSAHAASAQDKPWHPPAERPNRNPAPEPC